MIPKPSATVAEVLGYYGYATCGLRQVAQHAAQRDHARSAPSNWPTGGTASTTSTASSRASPRSGNPQLVENTNRHRDRRDRKGYHLTEDMADKAIHWLRQQQRAGARQAVLHVLGPGRVPWTAPHHEGVGGQVQGQVRRWLGRHARARLRAAKGTRLDPADTKLTPRPKTLAAWDDIPEEEKPFQRRLMEVFAGYTEHADYQAGRVIDELDRLGNPRQHARLLHLGRQRLVCRRPERLDQRIARPERHSATRIKEHLRALNELGGLDVLGVAKTDNMYHAGWAWAGSTPYQGTKLLASLRRHAQAAGGVVAEVDQGGQDTASPVPSRQRHRADDLRHPGDHDAEAGRWVTARTAGRRQHDLRLCLGRCARPQAHAVLRDHG